MTRPISTDDAIKRVRADRRGYPPGMINATIEMIRDGELTCSVDDRGELLLTVTTKGRIAAAARKAES